MTASIEGYIISMFAIGALCFITIAVFTYFIALRPLGPTIKTLTMVHVDAAAQVRRCLWTNRAFAHTQDGDIPLNVIGDAAGQRNLPSTETHTGACACARARTRPHPPLWRNRRKFTSNHHDESAEE